VDPDSILTLLGTESGKVDAHTVELIGLTISKCREVMAPQAGYARFGATDLQARDEIEMAGTRFRTGKIIRKLLAKSEEYAFFAATAGPGPENLSRSLIGGGHYLEGYITDLVGSGIVEEVASLLHRHIGEEASSSGLKVTNRYSPGYCSWDVSEQQKLFSLLPSGCCGITLSDSSLMSPIKSISGIIGIGSSVDYSEYICEICSMKDCVFRQITQRESRPS
jgi:hypothetical protein